MDPARALLGDDADIIRERDFQLILLSNLSGPLGIALVSPLLAAMAVTYGVPETRIGLMMSAVTAPMIVAIPLVGYLSDRYGRKPLLVAGLLLFGVSGAALSLTADFRVAIALRLVQGVGAAGIVPVLITSIGDLYTGSREAAAQGFRFTTSGLTQTVFPAIAGFLAVFGWRYPILLYATAIPIAVVVWRYFEEPRDVARTDGGPRHGSIRDLGPLLAEPRVRRFLLVYGIPAALNVGFFTYVSIIVVRILGGSAADAGLIVAATTLAKAMSASQAGRLTAAFDTRAAPIVGGNVAVIIGFALVGFAPGLVVAGAGAAVLGAGTGLLLSLYRSIITGLAPPELRGSLVSVGESIIRIDLTVLPVVLGLAVEFLAPGAGFGTAVRWTVFATGAIGGSVGMLAATTARSISGS